MLTRRQLLKAGTLAGVALVIPARSPLRPRAVTAGAGSLAPGQIPKFLTPLVIPPAMPRTGVITGRGKKIDVYEIAVRQFAQPILPASMGLPPTTVWGYGSARHPGTFHAPSYTLEAKWDQATRVTWINDLKDPVTGAFLPHLLPVDPTLHWANPPGGVNGRDMAPSFAAPPGSYRGPVPFVTHLHGGHNAEESDGYPEAWYLPAAADIPTGYATTGSWYEPFKSKFEERTGITWAPGSATFQYSNDQRAATLWYHDHTLGITRLNVYAGPAGFYLLRGGPSDGLVGTLPGPAPALGDAAGLRYFEIPLAIQDRSFTANGELRYPASRGEFDEFSGPYVPDSDIAPIWNPEVFGDTIMVNGRTWPRLDVEARRYRLRILNGCNSRFLILRLDHPSLTFWQIGADGGFLARPVELEELLLGPAERADVVVDFSRLRPGQEVRLLNFGPDEPFSGGMPGEDFEPADADGTGQVMLFRVVQRSGSDRSTRPDRLILPAATPLGPASRTRSVSLNEVDSAVLEGVGPRAALLGTLADEGGVPLGWDDSETEHPALGATEVWEIHNFTEDAHPIHIHEVMFEVVDREPFGGDARGPEVWESGPKDTVIAYPGEVTRVKARFDLPGLYVWHCHILEHEDHEMMRPYRVG